jgi:hypothetical protein
MEFDKEGKSRKDRVAHLCDAEQFGKMTIAVGLPRTLQDLGLGCRKER